MASWVTIVIPDGSKLAGRLVEWRGDNVVVIERRGRRYAGVLERGMAVVK